MLDRDPSCFTNRYRVSQEVLRKMFEEGELAWENVYKDKAIEGWTPYDFWLHVCPGIDLTFSDKEFELIGDLFEDRIFIVEIDTGRCTYMRGKEADERIETR